MLYKCIKIYKNEYLFNRVRNIFLGELKLNIELTSNDLTIDEFSKLRSSVNLSSLLEEQIDRALSNSLYTVCARNNKEAVGMGRLVGDGAYVYYLQNIYVMPEYQRLGIGSLIINSLLDFIRKDKIEGTDVMVLLMSSKNSEGFYKKFGFRLRPNKDEGCGMIINM